MSIFDRITGLITQFKGVQPSDYCHLETSATSDSNAILLTSGGFISAINLEGLNRLFGAEESKDAHKAITKMLTDLVRQGHEVDWGYSQNSYESEKSLNEFFKPMKETADIIGIDLKRALDENINTFKKYTRPERNTIYIITKLKEKENVSDGEKAIGAAATDYMKLFTEHRPAQSFLGVATYSDDVLNKHESAVMNALQTLVSAGYTANELTKDELCLHIKEDCEYETIDGWSAWLWGDKTRYRITPEDNEYGESGLLNWGGLSLGMQLHAKDIQPVSTGILKVGDYYVAPILIEQVPSGNNWLTELFNSIPNDLPFRYRAYIKSEMSLTQKLSGFFANATNFSRKHLKRNAEIADSFNYIKDLNENNIQTASIAISLCTWSKSIKQLRENMATLNTKVSSWGRAQTMVERGDPEESVIATIPGYSTSLFVPSTLESVSEIAKLVPHSRPAAPFDDGYSLLRTKCGKAWPVSPTSKRIPAPIEIIIAGAGSGKSVAQNTINRDSNLKPGNKELARHATLDVGPSGKGTVKGIRSALPANRENESIYEKLSLGTKHAFNMFDLQLGATRPTDTDRGTIQDFIEILVTPKNYDKPAKLMAELVTEVIDAAYERCFNNETAKPYKPRINAEIDEILNEYERGLDKDELKALWGMKKTWRKIRDFLFEKNHIHEAKIAQRYMVPLVPELPQILNQTPNIRDRFKPELIEEFGILISSASKNYPLITEPTAIDFESAKYIVFDLNDVTQQDGSQQTIVMYALTGQMATRDYWLNIEDLKIFESKYRNYNTIKIDQLSQSNLGVTFEEFRRTKGLPKLRSIIGRWMAEGRKWGVRVQLVMQQPEHADEEMFSHATMLTLMGTWNKTMLEQLNKRVALTDSEKDALMNGKVHGPRAEGSSMLIKYNLKDSGWGSQVLYLTKSTKELWETSTTLEDVNLKDAINKIVCNDEITMQILCSRFKKGTAIPELEKQKKELRGEDMNTDIYEKLAIESIRSWQIMNGKEVA